MKLNVVISLIAASACLGVLWTVQARHRQLAALRSEQKGLLAEAAAPDPQSSPAANRNSDTAGSASTAPTTSTELLRLRGQVTRLMARERELSGVRAENDRLRAQWAAQPTNGVRTLTLPPGYILRSQAKWSGFASPDDTIQSFLWAAQNRDLTNLLRTLTPEASQAASAQVLRSGETMDKIFGEGISHLPGMRIVDRQQLAPDAWELKIQMSPSDPETQPMRVRLINGEWKLDMK